MLICFVEVAQFKTFLPVIGYGVDSDFRNLVSSCPLYEHAVTHLARFVDLCPLSKQVGRQPAPSAGKRAVSQVTSGFGLAPDWLKNSISALIG